MADYFTNFSCELNVGSYENAVRAMEIYKSLENEADPDFGRVDFVVSLDEQSPEVLSIHDDVTGEPEQVIQFVLQCAHELNLTGRWGLEWSNSCSRPHVDAFGGGAVILDLSTRTTVAELSTNLWVHEHLDTGGDHG